MLLGPNMPHLTEMDPIKAKRNGSTKMAYEVYFNGVEGLQKYAGKLLECFGNPLNSLQKRKPPLSLSEPVKVEGSVFLDRLSRLLMLVEAAGVEPASESIHLKLLHAYSALCISL